MASPAFAARVDVPAFVTAGRSVEVSGEGLSPNGLVQIQFGVYFSLVTNCCVSRKLPSADDAYQLDAEGAGRFRVQMPRVYAACVTNGCRSPVWTRWRKRQTVEIHAYPVVADADGALTTDYSQSLPSDFARVRCSSAARCLPARRRR